MDLGHHMLDHDKDGPYWLLADARHAHRYFRTFTMDPRANEAMKQEGIWVKGKTLAEVARAMGVDPRHLQETVDRFKGFAHAGVDGDFGRENSAYDRYYSDPTVHPTPTSDPSRRALSPPFDWSSAPSGPRVACSPMSTVAHCARTAH